MDMANYALATHLAGKGGEVHLVAHRAEAELTAYPNVHFHRVPKPARSYLLGEPLLNLTGRQQAARLVNGHVLVNGGNCLWPDANWAHYIHAAYTPVMPNGSLYKYRRAVAHRRALKAERKAMAKARVVICNSRKTQRDVIEKLNVPEERTSVVYYGIDAARFGFVTPAEKLQAKQKLGWSETSPTVLFIGALSDRRKGFDTLFAAWTILCSEKSWDAELAVVGQGVEVSHWRQKAQALGIEQRIRFLGFRQDIPDLLAASDALVHPARYEAYGLGVREALSRGVPALVSADAGVAEHYEPALSELLISNPDDEQELASLLRNWRNHRERFEQDIAALSNSIRQHTWEKMAVQISQVVESASYPSRV